ncbi:MAG: DUF4870 domain-containing protein [Actinomycetes bacterium]
MSNIGGSNLGEPGFGGSTSSEQLNETDAHLWAMLAHLGGIILGFLAPLIVMLVQGSKSDFVRRQSTEALNFQITVLIGYVIGWVLTFLVIGLIVLPLVWIGSLVFAIMGGLAANRGEEYRYPVALRLVK